MKIVWDRESSRSATSTGPRTRKVAYTTVMTMMKILEQKAPQEEPGRPRLSHPPAQAAGDQPWSASSSTAFQRVRRRPGALVEEHHLSREDLDEISRLRRKS
jgi:hypothetical protein